MTGTQKTRYTIPGENGDRQVIVEDVEGGSCRVTIGEQVIELDARCVRPGEYHVLVGDRSVDFTVEGQAPALTVHHGGTPFHVELCDERATARRLTQGGDRRRTVDGMVVIAAPMPGKVVKRLVREGERVTAGQGVIVVEAMKMENELRSSVDGVVKTIKVAEGDNVDAGACLLVVE